MKVLVTGGAGFIGSNLVRKLLNDGYEVRILDDFSTGKEENIKEMAKEIEIIEGDLRNEEDCQKAVSDCEIIFHQGAIPSVPRSIDNPISTYQVNVNGTLNLLLASRDHNISKVVFASSSSIYGDTPTLPKIETMSPSPQSPYASSKLAGENICQVFARTFRVPTICLRYFNVYGPRQDPTSQYAAVIPKFITALLNNEQPIVYGDGEQSRDFTYIEDVIQANIKSAKSEANMGEVLNIACHAQITLNQLLEQLKNIIGKDIEAKYTDPRPGDVKHSYAAIDKARNLIGYQPNVDFSTGLENTIEFFNNQ